jgi:hypothetical protein
MADDMKEIILYEDEDIKKIAIIGELISVTLYYKCNGALKQIDDMLFKIEDIKKIYHAIEEEG